MVLVLLLVLFSSWESVTILRYWEDPRQEQPLGLGRLSSLDDVCLKGISVHLGKKAIRGGVERYSR